MAENMSMPDCHRIRPPRYGYRQGMDRVVVPPPVPEASFGDSSRRAGRTAAATGPGRWFEPTAAGVRFLPPTGPPSSRLSAMGCRPAAVEVVPPTCCRTGPVACARHRPEPAQAGRANNFPHNHPIISDKPCNTGTNTRQLPPINQPGGVYRWFIAGISTTRTRQGSGSMPTTSSGPTTLRASR